MNAPSIPYPRLTSLAHGGGCGCKIAPGVLTAILQQSAAPFIPAALLAGNENNEDAAVYQLNAEQAIVATTDFFTPIVDDPYEFGRIAATNAISDIYAMGAKPLFALALLGMPLKSLPLEVIRLITEGGQSICTEAGIPIAGGHSIDTVEPIYGLVVLGLVHPKRLKRNSGARTGDTLILSKPIGIGILSAALKQGMLSTEGYREMLALTTQLNRTGAALAELPAVHALTDVTGFGLAGHLMEMCRGAGLAATLHWPDVPVIGEALELICRGVVTGASARNWNGYGANVELPHDAPPWLSALVSDPQTSGGLLVSCAPSQAPRVLSQLKQDGFDRAAIIGSLAAGEPRVVLQ